MRHSRKEWKRALDMELREHRSSFAVYVILRFLVILAMIRQFFLGNYESVFLCILYVVSWMGYYVTYRKWFSYGGDWLRVGRSPESRIRADV